MNDDVYDDDLPERTSRSQRKREAHALRDLGAELVALSAEQLRQVPLPDDLRAAVEDATRIKSHGARRRQLQRVAKLMRATDPEPVKAALDQLDQSSAAARAQQQRAEHWRARLLAEGDQALSEWLREYPDADPQPLRQLIRNARREQAASKPPKAARELFRLLRGAMAKP
ncbi:ribosome biogenesis factor YjgA [Alkalilimnicola sp. S0819]|uniref:ribosome biogenesis factor YjgA n=1 Tax=Alkalilimnicola sp. S0819 TaxID=2613922 RepID=UPI0012614A65|nr:ribosome biogenesis factor YjgA [Alkalilimnicola sp. S0819]KAB7623936.1 DUF615 domain-containing protein [Alkalilimnicola sp. S0819]MPQ16534.1 DUF615 domain-containing protein [Alkalilimnicola sp. S0819]